MFEETRLINFSSVSFFCYRILKIIENSSMLGLKNVMRISVHQQRPLH